MNTYLRKYPRTVHLPFSGSKTSDDVTGASWKFLREDLEVVITEKMDGENTTLYRDRFHARSVDSKFHESRSWVAGLWGRVSWMIPEGRRVVVENVYAEHSIRYDKLPTFAFGICVIDLLDADGKLSEHGVPTVLSWDDSLKIFAELGITPVPLLYRGKTSMKHLREVFESLDTYAQEGIVVRTAGSFLEEDFWDNSAKGVRKGHVQTDQHWTRTWRPNKML